MRKARMVGLRIYLCASSTLSAWVLLQGHAKVFNVQDSTGQAVAALLLLTMCVFGILDVLVNDLLGDRWHIQWSERWRHDGYLALAAANCSLIFVAANGNSIGDYLVRFALDAAMAVYVAYRDVQLRFVEPRKERQKHADHRA